MPVVAVLGNHDHQCDQGRRWSEVLERRRASPCWRATAIGAATAPAHRLGVAGVKGFGGGFAGRVRQRVRRAGDEGVRAAPPSAIAERLGAALRDLDCDVLVALTHYAPVPDTLAGEPLEIYPFLGSYLLGQAIDSAPTRRWPCTGTRTPAPSAAARPAGCGSATSRTR